MPFEIVFTGPSSDPLPRAVEHVPEAYDVLVMEACAILADVGCRFQIGGFGDPNWPLDIAYDFSSVMEQLPEVLAGLRDRQRVELDLYGQGVERSLVFEPDGAQVCIRCVSRTSWRPTPTVETLPLGVLEPMFVSLAEAFVQAVSATCPVLAEQLKRHWSSLGNGCATG